MRIKNWDKWQTYRKDRGSPPWIKVHRNLMTNPEWAALSDAEKGQLISIWIVAADKGGEIPENPQVLRKVAMLDDVPNLNKFIDLGFIESTGCQSDAKPTPSESQSDAPETETETETEKKHMSESDDSHDSFLVFWKLYPRKDNKKKAETAWKRLSKAKREMALQGLEDRFTGIEKQFIPMPTTYINGERWNDEPPSAMHRDESELDKVKRLNREREAAEEAQGSSECLDVDFTNLGFH